MAEQGPTEVTLIDGRTVASDSAEWRAECEARYVCGFDSQNGRRQYLDRVTKHRGEAAAQQLECLAREVWRIAAAARRPG